MPINIQLKVDTKKAEAYLSKVPKQLDSDLNKEIERWGKRHAVPKVLAAARSAGIKPFRGTGGLFSSTRWLQKKKIGYLLMPKSGMYQDHAKPHWVQTPTSKGVKPMLQSWLSRYWGRKSGRFYFRPKPFINTGLNNAYGFLPVAIRKAVKSAIRRV